MKYLKTFLESADIPELVGRFSPEELRVASTNEDPYAEKPMRPFQMGYYAGKAGKASSDLEDMMHDNMWGNMGSKYGISDYFYNNLVSKVPEFEGCELRKNDDKEDGILGIYVGKKYRIIGTKYNAAIEIWIHFHTKNDKILEYKKGKIKLLFACGLNEAIEGSFNRVETRDEDKLFDSIMADILKDHPDRKYSTSLHIKGKNLNKDSFLKRLPQVRKDFKYFENYVIPQAIFEFQEHLYLNDFQRFFELIMHEDANSYDDISPRIIEKYKDQIPQKIKVGKSSARFDL